MNPFYTRKDPLDLNVCRNYNDVCLIMDVRKAVLIFAGTVCVALGVLGMFLPLLPTTVFLLMAAYCYSRSSERFHTWLIDNRWLGGYIRNYKSGQGVSLRQKITTISILWVSIGFSIWMIGGAFWASLILLSIAVAVTAHLLWIKTYRPETNVAHPLSASEKI
jgi:uncharacterized protein